MVRHHHRIIPAIALTLALAAAAPASARFELNPPLSPQSPAPAASGQTQAPIAHSVVHCFPRVGCLSIPSVHAGSGAVHPARPTGASSQDGFQWDAAGIGAAGMLSLFAAAGASSVLARRRRQLHTPAS
jgi:hypothetical protein